MAKKRSLCWRTPDAFLRRNLQDNLAIWALMLISALTLVNEMPLVGGDCMANADNDNPKAISQKREAWMDASDYSVAHPNVASFAVNGRAQNATNQQIVNYIQERFASHGITNSFAFAGREESVGVSMYFFLNGHQYGPTGFADMNGTIDQVAGHVRGLLAK